MSENNLHPSLICAKRKILEGQLLSLLDGATTDYTIMRSEEDPTPEWQDTCRSNNLLVTEDWPKNLWRICREVTNSLGLQDPVDFYIQTSEKLNAYTIPSWCPKNLPHVIALTSKAVDSLSDNELKFVIGHEVGHILMDNCQMERIFRFRYPSPELLETIPNSDYYRMAMWRSLCELSADIYGYTACVNLRDALVGLGEPLYLGNEKGIANFLRRNDQQLNMILKQNGSLIASGGVHPIPSLRTKSLVLYSETLNGIDREDEVNELINHLDRYFSSSYAKARFALYGAVSILLCRHGGHIKSKTKKFILEKLADFNLWYERSFENMLNSGLDLQSLANENFGIISMDDPNELSSLLQYVVRLIFTDKTYCQAGVDLIFSWGKEHGFTLKVISEEIRAYYRRRYDS